MWHLLACYVFIKIKLASYHLLQMRLCVTSKNVNWPGLIWPTLYLRCTENYNGKPTARNGTRKKCRRKQTQTRKLIRPKEIENDASARLSVVWSWQLTFSPQSWSFHATASCRLGYLTCYLAWKSFHSFSTYRDHNYGNRRTNDRL